MTRNQRKDNVHLKIPALKIADHNTERKTVIKFLGAISDQNITWKKHFYRVEPLLQEKVLESIYFAYIL